MLRWSGVLATWAIPLHDEGRNAPGRQRPTCTTYALHLVVKCESMTSRPVETLGARIKRFREKAGMTQAQVREALGLGKVAVSEYENGKTNPSEDILERLGKLYSVRVEVLRYGEAALTSSANDYWAAMRRRFCKSWSR